MTEPEINSASDVIAEIQRNKLWVDVNNEIWFRGQSNYDYELTPSLFRNGFYDEAKMIEEFIRRHPDSSNKHANVFEWLTLMQHYGLPTRLLDWTTNLLVALYFCCNDDKDKDGAIFAFNPSSIFSNAHRFYGCMEALILAENSGRFYERLIDVAYKNFGEFSTINGISVKDWKSDFTHLKEVFNSKTELKSFVEILPMPSQKEVVHSDMVCKFSSLFRFKPAHLNDRMRRQHGCFTLHGGKFFLNPENNKPEAFIETNRMEDRLKSKIKSDKKARLIQELALFGISEATLFPEMEYQCKQIKNQFKCTF